VKLSVHTLLNGAVDYAGLFPPAGLDMASAVRNYSRYVSGEDAWALGRFVVPVSRLEEFNFHVQAHALEERTRARNAEGRGESWSLSALSDGDLGPDLDRVKQFNRWHGERDERPRVNIDAIEVKVASKEAISAARKLLSDSLRVFFEVPVEGEPDALLSAIAAARGAAKVRTGGASHEMAPTAQALVGFFDACLRHGVRFKATGGLHHPLCKALATDPGAPGRPHVTHGFLNVLLTAAFLYDGMSPEEALAVATEQSAGEFPFDDVGVEWKGHRLTAEAMSVIRRDFAVSFGSSSFEEPMAGLRRLKLC